MEKLYALKIVEAVEDIEKEDSEGTTNTMKEVALVRIREQELIQREIDLLQKENDLLKKAKELDEARTSILVEKTSSINIRYVQDIIPKFMGSDPTYPVQNWIDAVDESAVMYSWSPMQTLLVALEELQRYGYDPNTE